MSKRINSFFQPIPSKKPKSDPEATTASSPSAPVATTHHPTYPMPIRDLPSHLFKPIANLERVIPPKAINNQPHLDLLYFQPFLPSPIARDLFNFLRNELPFYRVQYTIRRGPTETLINTPRYTTVFGVDETSIFIPGSQQDTPTTNSKDPNTPPIDSSPPKPPITLNPSLTLVESRTRAPPTTLKDKTKYNHPPRPIPPCLDVLRQAVEAATADGTHYNFCLVNYYATGDDSISYHSDDERFLGPNPTIASISLGGQRDFLLKHKPVAGSDVDAGKPLKFPLDSGDMIIMRGETQANWLHSIPKRKGAQGSQGRINITFRKAVVPGGTNNYYRYNVGDGAVYRWDESGKRMVAVKKEKESEPEGEKELQKVDGVKA
ncbi:alpha-ketoglutarate-dependent dioxygenase AlkB family protein, partial [Aspergillus homomorphus CBS 101889]